MKRLYAGAVTLGLMLGTAGAQAVTSTASETFEVSVGTIVEFITTKSNAAGGAISNWDVDDAAGGDEATATVVFRLVTNADTTLTGTFLNTATGTNAGSTSALIGLATDEILLTYANIQSDGDGATAVTLGADGHNATTDLAHTGFASGVHNTLHGVGVSTAADRFAYIGGLASLASSGAVPADTAAEVFGATGTSDFLNGATGVTITHISHDGAALLTVQVRGFNGEDYGAASDFTEAPDVDTYRTALTLTAVAP